MEYDIFRKLVMKLSKQSRICIISGLVVGWFTHFYMLTHKLPNWDDLANANNAGAGVDIGRWLLGHIHPMAGRYSIPVLHGVFYIVMLTLAACVVLEILQLKSNMAAVLVPAVMVTFPSVTSVMTFMFTAHNYGLSVLMMCLAVYFVRKYRYGWIPGILLLTCSMAIYQSYISIAIALMLMGMISDILRDKEAKSVFWAGVKCVGVLLATVALYMLVCTITNPRIWDVEYAGIGNMGQISIAEMPILIAKCYKRFLEYFIWKPFAFLSETAQIINIIVCLLIIVTFIYLVWVKRLYMDKVRLLLAGMLLFWLPLAVAFVYFMAPEAPYSMLMLYAYCFIYIMLLTFMELCMEHWQQEQQTNSKWLRVRQGSVILATVLVIISCYTDYLLANEAYLRMDIAKERTVAYFNRIISSVESQEGFAYGDKVVILGEFYYVDNPSPIDSVADDKLADMECLRELSGVAFENGLITSGVRNSFIRTYIGFEMYDIAEEEKMEIVKSDAYEEMAIYPSEESIQKFGDIWVVKLCNNEW